MFSVAQSCLTLLGLSDSSVHGIFQERSMDWGCHFLRQGIFPTQGLNPRLLHLLHWHVDLVEIDAGDTYAYDEEAKKSQKDREEAAKERIFSLLPDDQKAELTALFEEFEEQKSPEARFAKAMDNLQPLILNHSNGGSDWAEHGVSAGQVYLRQSQTKQGSEKLYEITDAIIQENIRKGSLKK